MSTAIAIAPIFVLLTISEWLWLDKQLHHETARKLVHILVGTFVAFWPFFLGWHTIRVLSILFFLVILISKRLGIFESIHAVPRKTWGEMFFAIAILLVAFLTDSKWLFAASILHLSLADGLAGLVGTRYGERSRYKVFGLTNSILGSVVFWGVSLATLLIIMLAAHSVFSAATLMALLLVSTTTALIESVSFYGVDNLVVPLFIVFVVGALRLVG